MAPKKDPNKPRGRMTGYAYFVQTCREEHKRKHPNEQIVFTEFSKKCAKRWKPMIEKEKKAFTDMADRDRIRYEREMKNYVPPPGSGKKQKRKKDPNAPKRPHADRRGGLKAENPGWSVGEIAKELGKMWADASPEVKKKYSEQGEKEKEKYNKEMEKYRAQLALEKSSNSKAVEKQSKAVVSESDDSDSDSDEN